MSKEDIRAKELQVEISRLEHTILEKELKLLKKYEEIDRLEKELTNNKELLKTKKEGKK